MSSKFLNNSTTASKIYVDGEVQSSSEQTQTIIAGDYVSKITLDPQTIGSTLTVADLSTSSVASLNTFSTGISNKVNKAGDTMTGSLNMTVGEYQQDGISASLPLLKGTDSNNLMTQSSGTSITTGAENISYGLNNMTLLDTGSLNVAVGDNVLQAITTQARNVGMGDNTMEQYTGNFGVAIGWTALQQGSGDGNTAVGDGAMKNLSTGDTNTTIGQESLVSLTTGSGNVALGALSGLSLTTESECVLLGVNTQSAGFGNTVALGTGASATKSNQCMIGGVNIQEIVVGNDNACNLGSATRQMKDLYLGGTAYLPFYQVPNIEQKVYSQVATLNRANDQGFEDMTSSAITIPANTLREGTTLCFELGGNCVEKKSDEIEFRLIGETSTTLYTTQTLECKEDTSGSQGWKLTVWATVRGTGVATLSLLGDWEYTKDNGNKLAGSHFNSDSVAIDTTVEQNLKWQMSLLDGSGANILEYNITNAVVKICV
jgi:hypothetical protein